MMLTKTVSISLVATMLVLVGCSEPNNAAKKSRSVSNRKSVAAVAEGFDSFSDSLFRRRLSRLSDVTSDTMFSLVQESGINFTNTFPRDHPHRLAETGSGVAIADYDNDGQTDVYLLAVDGPNQLFRGFGNFKFEDVTELLGVDGTVLGKNAWASGASFADVDNDGDLDLFVCNMASSDILYVNNGDGTFKDEAIAPKVNDTGTSKMGSFCDYDRDGDLNVYVVA